MGASGEWLETFVVFHRVVKIERDGAGLAVEINPLTLRPFLCVHENDQRMPVALCVFVGAEDDGRGEAAGGILPLIPLVGATLGALNDRQTQGWAKSG